LADGDFGQDPIDEVRRSICHASASAGWTEASAFTRESDSAIKSAGFAANANKAVAKDSALEKAPKLTLDEARQATLLLLSASQESLQVLLDDLVQQGLLGLAPLVLDGFGPSRDLGPPR
jgi:hypothetical protein